MVKVIESFLFSHKKFVIALFALATVILAKFALDLKVDSGFEKQLPLSHEIGRAHV